MSVPLEEVRVSGDELCSMLALSNFFEREESLKEYNSLSHLAQVFERTKNPSRSIYRLLRKMMDRGFFVVNKRENIEFDGDAFDAFVDAHVVGKSLWEYVGNRVTYFRFR